MSAATWPIWLIAVFVAQAEERRKRKEEEDMTPYTDAELAEGFEFRIPRSVNGAFRKPEFLLTTVAAEGHEFLTAYPLCESQRRGCRVRAHSAAG